MGKSHSIHHLFQPTSAVENTSNLFQIWNADFAYCLGIMAPDGNLSKNGRHISITSKDSEIIENCRKAFKPSAKIARKSRGGDLKEKKYFLLQFSDVALYKFMQSIGLTPAKSMTIQSVHVPWPYFRDFLRGEFDGDGSISIFKNKVSKQPQVKIRFYSASLVFLTWLKDMIALGAACAGGYIQKTHACYSLEYGKADAGKIIKFMYYSGVRMYLSRKYEICGRVVKR